MKLVWGLCIPLVVLYLFAGKYLLLLFMDSNSVKAMETGIQFLCILSPFYFVVSAKLVADGILRGTGVMKQFMIATFTDLILRVILAVIFSKIFGAIGIWFAWPIGWSVATSLSIIFYRYGFWNKEEN